MLAVLSCQEEIRMEDPSDRISFNVTNDPETVTKGSAEDKSVTLEIGGRKFSLSMTEEGNDTGAPATRGSAYDNSTHLIPSIYVSAIVENGNGGNPYFNEENISLTYSGDGEKQGNGTSERFWPEQRLSFMAYAVSKQGTAIEPSFQRADGKCSASFSYTLPAAMTSDAKNDATAQPDIVFAISPDQTGPASVNLVFHHALSAINFKVGKMNPENVYIKSIALKGVYNSGECSMTAAAGNDIDFTWTYEGQEQNGLYTEDIKTDAVEGNMMNDTEATFMMLPQAMSEETKFVMTFSIEDREYTLETGFDAFLTSWEADKKYVFKIGLPDEIDVDIEDQVEGLVKKNVTIKNPGIATGYIRAAVVGYWINNSTGRICDPWRADEGTFVYGAEWNSKWKKGADGFYYHLEPVEHNAFTYPLFNTYTLTESATGQHSGQTLEIDLAVQIIPVSAKALWTELNDVNP